MMPDTVEIEDIATTKTAAAIDPDGDYLVGQSAAGSTFRALVEQVVRGVLSQLLTELEIGDDLRVSGEVQAAGFKSGVVSLNAGQVATIIPPNSNGYSVMFLPVASAGSGFGMNYVWGNGQYTGLMWSTGTEPEPIHNTQLNGTQGNANKVSVSHYTGNNLLYIQNRRTYFVSYMYVFFSS